MTTENPVAGISSEKLKLVLQAGFAGIFLLYMILDLYRSQDLFTRISQGQQLDAERERRLTSSLIRLIEHNQRYQCSTPRTPVPDPASIRTYGLTKEEMEIRFRPREPQPNVILFRPVVPDKGSFPQD